jgi:cholesterol oxidase
VFDEPGWPAAINGRELDRYYRRTEEALQPRQTPDQPPLPKVRAFSAVGRSVGREATPLPLAVHFGEERRHPFSGVFQRGCDNLGRCDVGCTLLAKNTVDITYIAKAETHGVEIYASHEVLRIQPPAREQGSWRVGFRDLQYRVKGAVEAPLLVLAAGTVGSARLLLKNRPRLGRLSPALGTRFSGNGDALALALDPRAAGVVGARTEYGPSMTSRLDYTNERGFMVADGGLPGNFAGLLEIIRGVSALTGWGRVVLHAKNFATRLGFSDRHVTHRNVRLKRHPPIGDSLIF